MRIYKTYLTKLNSSYYPTTRDKNNSNCIPAHFSASPHLVGKKSGLESLFQPRWKNRNAPVSSHRRRRRRRAESRRGSGAFFALVVAARNSRATRRILGRRAENKSAEAQCTRAPVNIRRKEKTKWWRRQREKEGGKARRYSISPQIRFEWN